MVELIWPRNITKPLSMVMIHEQASKEKNSGRGGGRNKKNNPRRNRGGGNNDNDNGANVSVTNALEPPKTEGKDALEANQDEPNAEMVSKDPAPTSNGDNAAVWFVLSFIGDEFDDSLNDNMIWQPAEESNKTMGIVRVSNNSGPYW